MIKKNYLQILLLVAVLFFLFEAILHFFGLSLLEHDRIFLFTHDRYIALFSLSYALLFLLVAYDPKKYKTILLVLLFSLFLLMLNGFWIAQQGGYMQVFGTLSLDRNLSFIGFSAVLWFLLVLIFLLQKETFK